MTSNKDLVRAAQRSMVKGTVSKDAGSALLLTGAGGLAIGGVAWLLPFISLPMLLVVAVLLGGYLYAR